MRSDDFFTEIPDTTSGPGSDPWSTQAELDVELLTALRQGPVAGRDEVSTAQALVDLVHEELELYGTNGGNRLN